MSSTLQVLQGVNTILFGMVQVNQLLNQVSVMIQKKQQEASPDFNDEEWQVIRALLEGSKEKLKKAIDEAPETP